MSCLLKKILFGVAMLFAAAPAMGQKPVIDVAAPATVVAGDVFKVEYSSDIGPDSFKGPEITNFDILAGPSPSSSRQVVFVNGNVESRSSFTYTYALTGSTPGKYKIPRATFTINGAAHHSRAVDIEVVADSSGSASQTGTLSRLAADDILLKVTVDKTTVFKGQPVRLEVKVYSRVPLSYTIPRPPSFNWFWVQNITASNYPVQTAKLNNKDYEVRVASAFLLYPQQAGKLLIEQMEIEAVAHIMSQNSRQSVFDDFFGGGANVEEIRRKVTSAPVTINVIDLPADAPASFNGAVGDFTMDVGANQTAMSENSGSAYFIKISGTGNLPLIQIPKVELPASFEQYTPKTIESLNPGSAGIRGFRQFEYPFIARAQGSYRIEPFEFTFFNPEQAKYVTLTSEGVDIGVAPDASGSDRSSSGAMITGRDEVKILGEDIRFIKVGHAAFAAHGSVFMGSVWYYGCMVLMVLLFLWLFYFLRKRIEDRRNTVAIKGRRANKVALQRLHVAEGFIDHDTRRQFYDEMLRALWGYMSDKLNIPASNLTKDNVREGLAKRGVGGDQAERFIAVISDCELAQYSPDQAGHMREVYNQAISSISKLESTINKGV